MEGPLRCALAAICRTTGRAGPRRGLLACLLLALLLFPLVSAAAEAAGELPLQIELLDGDGRAAFGNDGKSVVLPADGRPVAMRLRFTLPPRRVDEPSWVLRFNRVELKELRLRANGWQPPAQDFFTPRSEEGRFPMAFEQPLPAYWRGEVEVDVVAASDLRRTLRPELLRATTALERDKQALAITVALYASLGVLGLMAFTLLLGTRERIFVTYMGLIASAFLLALAVNGHAHTLPGLHWMGALGAQSVNLAMFLLCASGIALVRDYLGVNPSRAWLRRVPRIGIGLMLLAAAACASGFAPAPGVVQYLVTLSWVLTVGMAIVVFSSASARQAWLGWHLLAAAIPLAVYGTLFELSVRGLAGAFWGSYGYLIGLVLVALLLMVAQIGRIADFRIRHEQERVARQASEAKLAQQVALVELTEELRHRLLDADPEDVNRLATQIALQWLQTMLQLSAVGMVAYRPGYPDTRLVVPAHTKRLDALMEANAMRLRALAHWQAPVQHLELAVPEDAPEAAYAGVPLITSSGSGVVVLERLDPLAFGADDLALVADVGQLALQQIAEARATHELRRSAELDALTGVLNRSAIDELLEQYFSEAHLHQRPLAVLFVDLDHFKSINDTWGHACGDHCLQRLAGALRSALRLGDHIGRYGGEEFLILLPGCDGEAAVALGERLRNAVEQMALRWQDEPVRLTISIGASARLPHEDKPDPAVARADQALYAAKRGGRNRVDLAS